ncbi:MAG: group II truncated hemoglobin [Gammaproteobacteria bacterium]|jgi:hemoglobin
MAELSPYERLGGEAAVRKLVDRFYDLMDTLPEAGGIRALHPADLTGSRDKLFKFLSGWLGGPPLYQTEYGHPRLRARHLPFPIGAAERDAWLLCMEQALAETEMEELLRMHLLQSLRNTADHMRNR